MYSVPEHCSRASCLTRPHPCVNQPAVTNKGLLFSKKCYGIRVGNMPYVTVGSKGFKNTVPFQKHNFKCSPVLELEGQS